MNIYSLGNNGITSVPTTGVGSTSSSSNDPTKATQVSPTLNLTSPSNNTGVKPRSKALNGAPASTEADTQVVTGITVDEMTTKGDQVVGEVSFFVMQTPVMSGKMQNYSESIVALLLSINSTANLSDIETQKELSNSQAEFNKLYNAFAQEVTDALTSMCQRGTALTEMANSQLTTQLQSMEKEAFNIMLNQCIATGVAGVMNLAMTHLGSHLQETSTQLEDISKTMENARATLQKNEKMFGSVDLDEHELLLVKSQLPAEEHDNLVSMNNEFREMDELYQVSHSEFHRNQMTPERLAQLNKAEGTFHEFSNKCKPKLERLTEYTGQEKRLLVRLQKNGESTLKAGELVSGMKEYGQLNTPEEQAAANLVLDKFSKKLDANFKYLEDPKNNPLPTEMHFTTEEWHYIRMESDVGAINSNQNLTLEQVDIKDKANTVHTKITAFNDKLTEQRIDEHLFAGIKDEASRPQDLEALSKTDLNKSHETATTVLKRVGRYETFTKELKTNYNRMTEAAEGLEKPNILRRMLGEKGSWKTKEYTDLEQRMKVQIKDRGDAEFTNSSIFNGMKRYDDVPAQDQAQVDIKLSNFSDKLEANLKYLQDPKNNPLSSDMHFTTEEWHYIRVGSKKNLQNESASPLANKVNDNIKSFKEQLSKDKPSYFKRTFGDGWKSNQHEVYNPEKASQKAAKYSRWAMLINAWGQTTGNTAPSMISAIFTEMAQNNSANYSTEASITTNNLNQNMQVNQTVYQNMQQIASQMLDWIVQGEQSNASASANISSNGESRNSSLWANFATIC